MRHVIIQRNYNECFKVSVNLAKLECNLPDDGRRPKHVGAILIYVLM
jgi:hypothetical protein